MISPDAYAELQLPDQWLEDQMQAVEAAWILEQTESCAAVIELGFGSGIITRALVCAGRQVTMVDGSEAFCATASKIPGVDVVHSMFEDFTPRVDKYNCVIASFILEHIADPVALLKRIRGWTDKLIVVVGNANSYHRQIAVRMGIQPRLDSLSERDVTVGHVKVYDANTIERDLHEAGWIVTGMRGLGLKVLPNAMLARLRPDIAKTMMQMECNPEVAANLFILAR